MELTSNFEVSEINLGRAKARGRGQRLPRRVTAWGMGNVVWLPYPAMSMLIVSFRPYSISQFRINS